MSVKLFSLLPLLTLTTLTHLSADSVPQKLTDKPIDKSIRIKTHDGGNYCYAPVFTKGEAYVYIDNCSSSYVQPARYDVFQRIAYKINNNWLCLTAPSSVTGIDGESTEQWDYVLLRPCVTNDANQHWIIKDNAIWTADGKYRIKDYQWYAFISKKSDDYYDHTLDSSMETWIKTIATPGNISLKTPLAWTFVDATQWGVYYIQNNQSTLDEVINLYYNPENGHIAQFYPSDGSLYCMTSNQNSKDDWNWVSWNVCSDNIPQNKDNKYWDTSFLVENKGAIRDYQGNILRITKYGTNWGVPYTAKPSYLQKDTSNTPESLFLFSHDIEKWNRYVDGNLGETLHYCPAPGHKAFQNDTRLKRSLPPEFKLNEEWRKRLYAIATSTDGSQETSGICGICLLQSYQMIAELQEYHATSPLQSGGYFFDTAPNTDPFVSFRQRFPSLNNIMTNAPQWYGVALNPSDTAFGIATRVAFSTTQSILPNFTWSLSAASTNRSEILAAIRALLDQRPGTIWIGLMTYTSPEGTITRHALPILRSSAGLKVIPSYTSKMTLFEFTDTVSDTTDPELVLLRLSNRATRNLTEFATLQLTGTFQNPLSVTFSENNCTGDGEDRRGSGRLPSSSLVNQCASGRCSSAPF